MSNALGPARAAALMRQKLDARVQARAEQLRDIAVQQHREAPRGGSYLNRYGQNRSAESETAAPEEGNLLNRLEMPPSPGPDGSQSVAVNYAVLEFGSAHVGARPGGRHAVAKLRQEVESGG